MWHDFISQAVVKRPNETFLKPEPIGTDIPILRGELDKNNIHNILFYLNRLSDPQYSNWEEGVQNWLKNNVLPDISDPAYSYNKEDEQTSDTGPNIEIIDLNNGDFVSNNPILQFKVLSNIGLQKIEIYINEQLLETITENLGIEFNYEKSIPSEVFKSQNKITILALDSMNIYNQKEIIVYK